MPSKKKTRKQKMQSDTRRIHHSALISDTYSLSDIPQSISHSETVKPVPQVQTIATRHYEYLTHDLRKTLILTVIIIAIQILLRMFVFK